VVRVEGARPRAYVAFAVEEVPEERQLAALGRLGFAEGGTVLVAPGAVPPRLADGVPLQAVPLRRSGDVLEATVDLALPGVLVVNEAFAAGWRARVDGAEVAVVAVNHAVLGVPLEHGPHQVRLEYEAPGLRAGGLATLASALLLLGYGLLTRRPRQRAR
jgi:hypothetical protein